MLVGQIVKQQAKQHIGDLLKNSLSELDPAKGTSRPTPIPDSPRQTESIPCDAMVVFASGTEARGLVDLLENVASTKCENHVERVCKLGEKRILVVELPGESDWMPIMESAIQLHPPKLIVSAGFCTALRPDIGPRGILIATHVYNEKGKELATGVPVGEDDSKRGLFYGKVVSVAEPPQKFSAKRRLREESKADGVDSDSWPIALFASVHRIRFIATRIITECYEETPPPVVESLLIQKSLGGKFGAALGSLWEEPSSAKELWKIHEQANRASERLGKFLVSVLTQT